MKKSSKTILYTCLVLALIACIGIKLLSGSFSFTTSGKIENEVKKYLTNKYGKHGFEIINIDNNYKSETILNSKKVGYYVYFKSDEIDSSFATVNNDLEVTEDYYLEDLYFFDLEGYEVNEKLKEIQPKEELNNNLLNILKDNFDNNIYEVECETINLVIPNNYGKTPTLEDLKTNIDLYYVSSFKYRVNNKIDNTDEYKDKLNKYIKDTYKKNANIYFINDNTGVSIILTNN